MIPNPALGVVFHWLGGLASGSFYVPYRVVKRWSWETYWLVGGLFSWIIAPWIIGFLLTKNLASVLSAVPAKNLFWCYFFGLLWGVGGLTFGLTMRYLGLSLGMAIVLGLCATFGTLMPPIFSGEFVSHILHTSSGQVILAGIGVCLLGIAIVGLAGIYKERAMPPEAQKQVIKEFDLRKGLLVATLSGVMSACFAYGLAAGDPIRSLTLRAGTPPLWQGLPVLVVILIGGFTTNFIWTVLLNIRNRTGHEYLSSEIPAPPSDLHAPQPIEETALSGPATSVLTHTPAALIRETVHVPLLRNYFLCALAGVTWYMQFFFYTMGETQMGRFKFSSWTIHMASIIIFSSLWGIGLKEWKGAGRPAIRLLGLGLAVLIGSTIVVGYGNYLATVSTPH
ncbi:MAG: L-rhamnose/proton symporter RhaT [Acidobacteriaceae bacterium]|nr:L-rhamnose/proton symporter RhaT [Acidobacteriaceae bacterium]MBV9296628.1 L-rhamnose/proton symporter RhaT [Acidobacteriaceae bacterium]MBV9765229.1 L-rhamnose/proton symporter RhaT [Acidobacteriaceae bacterium]